MKRQSDFIGQVNNILCFFRQQASAVKLRSSLCLSVCHTGALYQNG